MKRRVGDFKREECEGRRIEEEGLKREEIKGRRRKLRGGE